MAKERSGYVFEEQGKWYARLTYTEPSGQRRNIKRRAEGKTDAKAVLKQLLSELEDHGGKSLDASRMTFNDFADYFSSHYVQPAHVINGRKVAGLKDWKHYRTYITVFRSHFSRRLLREIRYEDLCAFRKERLNTKTQYERERSVTSVNREMAALRRMFNVAAKNQFVIRSPFDCGDGLISVAAEVSRDRVLSHAEQERLLEACAMRDKQGTQRYTHLKPILICLLETAMRFGEMASLLWKDCDLKARVIVIRAENSKTQRQRIVPITPALHAELLALSAGKSLTLDTRVFGIANNVRKSFATVCIAGKVSDFRLHDLRHTGITRMIAAGIPTPEVMKISGHTQVSTFLRYLNPTNEAMSRAADLLAAYNIRQFASVEVSSTIN
jgi:integrase